MAFSGNHIVNSFKLELLAGVHDFTPSTGDTFKLALYTDAASFDTATTAYTATNEISATGSYVAGGITLTQSAPALSSSTAVVDFADVTVTSCTTTTRGALLYNSTKAGNPVVSVLDFGADIVVVAADLTLTFPSPSYDAAAVRIA